MLAKRVIIVLGLSLTVLVGLNFGFVLDKVEAVTNILATPTSSADIINNVDSITNQDSNAKVGFTMETYDDVYTGTVGIIATSSQAMSSSLMMFIYSADNKYLDHVILTEKASLRWQGEFDTSLLANGTYQFSVGIYNGAAQPQILSSSITKEVFNIAKSVERIATSTSPYEFKLEVNTNDAGKIDASLLTTISATGPETFDGKLYVKFQPLKFDSINNKAESVSAFNCVIFRLDHLSGNRWMYQQVFITDLPSGQYDISLVKLDADTTYGQRAILSKSTNLPQLSAVLTTDVINSTVNINTTLNQTDQLADEQQYNINILPSTGDLTDEAIIEVNFPADSQGLYLMGVNTAKSSSVRVVLTETKTKGYDRMIVNLSDLNNGQAKFKIIKGVQQALLQPADEITILDGPNRNVVITKENVAVQALSINTDDSRATQGYISGKIAVRLNSGNGLIGATYPITVIDLQNNSSTQYFLQPIGGTQQTWEIILDTTKLTDGIYMFKKNDMPVLIRQIDNRGAVVLNDSEPSAAGEFQLTRRCQTFGITDLEKCKILESLYIAQECREAGLYTQADCQEYQKKLYFQTACEQQNLINPLECEDFFLAQYQKEIDCNGRTALECQELIRDNFFGSFLSTFSKDINKVIIPLRQQQTNVGSLSEVINNAGFEEELFPLSNATEAERNQKIYLAPSIQKTLIAENNNIYQAPPAVIMIDSDADGLIDDLERKFGTDVNNPDSDNDSYQDGEEIKNGYDPLGPGKFTKDLAPLDKAILTNQPLEQPIVSGILNQDLTIEKVENFPNGEGLKISGNVAPLETVAVFIYSTMPLVLTTQADEQGNWTYYLDKPLTNDRHEAYVTVTDETGKISGKSQALTFFVKEAKAVSVENYLVDELPNNFVGQSVDNKLWYFVIGGLGLIFVAIIVFVLFHLRRNHGGGNEAT